MMTDLASVLPALKEQLILTWLKRDLAEMTADAVHEDLLRLRGSDDQGFKRTLALYAGWAQYATALNDQLAQMNGGQAFTKNLSPSITPWTTRSCRRERSGRAIVR